MSINSRIDFINIRVNSKRILGLKKIVLIDLNDLCLGSIVSNHILYQINFTKTLRSVYDLRFS